MHRFMTEPIPRRPFLLGGLGLLLLGRGEGSAPVDGTLRGVLERVYIGWSEAMRRSDLTGFSRHTSRYRQMCLRNEVISLRQPWPRAVFRGIVQAPPLQGLNCVDAAEHGDTARLAYFGRVDFGLEAGGGENPVVLRFLREPDGWKFDWIQYVNLGRDEAARQAVRRGDRKWLESPQFQLTGIYPEVPKPCREPYQVAGLSVVAAGCRVTVELNGGVHRETVENDTGGRVITGGLQKGVNSVVIQPAVLPGANAVRLQVAVLTRQGSAARELWKWSPPDPAERWKGRYDASIFVRSAAAVR
jgi:hypothetical protein